MVDLCWLPILTVIQQAFNLTSVVDFSPRYNIAPTQNAPVITNEAPQTLSMYRWGLIPSWAKEESIGNKLINARAESASRRSRRSAVLSSGGAAWCPPAASMNGRSEHDGKTLKTPIYIHLKDQELFAMAGLWEVWHNPKGRIYHTFTILTTDANDFMEPIHNRMPVILHPVGLRRCGFSRTMLPPDVLQPLLKPFEADRMTAHEVSKAVNKPTIDMPELIQPVA